MSFIWDYNEKELKKNRSGRKLLLERKINYGPGKQKIKLHEVKKHWHSLNLLPASKRLLSLIIWGK